MSDESIGDGDIRAGLQARLAGRATVRIAEAAKLLNMTEKTLRRHVADGAIAFRATGTGSVRVRREFALSDLVGFYDGRRMVGVGDQAIRGRPVIRAGTGMIGFLAATAGDDKLASRARKRI
ncbi:helix-turn-helix domain-containing protein [Bradyrhizobium sp. WU425]|uniref:helix-turn-helix domain-containing protein n=1 Tax=Bradyrhizobium sp. WU425 TaxID=187029 RepID=UPI001E63A4C4|nr:helix-turn-helix domain-containing protein [Bradyrhizobium canariense]UFW72880.1 helix-turn-helix domain-containing protein [Bradyrhizobium canariense]